MHECVVLSNFNHRPLHNEHPYEMCCMAGHLFHAAHCWWSKLIQQYMHLRRQVFPPLKIQEKETIAQLKK